MLPSVSNFKYPHINTKASIRFDTLLDLNLQLLCFCGLYAYQVWLKRKIDYWKYHRLTKSTRLRELWLWKHPSLILTNRAKFINSRTGLKLIRTFWLPKPTYRVSGPLPLFSDGNDPLLVYYKTILITLSTINMHERSRCERICIVT